MRGGIAYTAAAALVAALVGLAGSALVEGPGRVGVWLGAGIACVVQVAGFWLLFVWVLPGHGVLAHGLGVLGRFLVLAVVALVGVPLLGVPAAPTLFSLVTVLFLTTLFEPVVFQFGFSGASRGDAVPTTTRR